MATKCRFEGVLEATECEKTTAVKKKGMELFCKYAGGFASILKPSVLGEMDLFIWIFFFLSRNVANIYSGFALLIQHSLGAKSIGLKCDC